MTSQSPRIYTYKITFEEVPYYYYGVHKEKRFDEEYWGSPVTHKWCWEFYTPRKQILQVYDITNENWLDALEIERRIIRQFYKNDKWCLNENCNGLISLNGCRKGGLLVGKITKENGTGIFSLTKDERIKISKIAGKISGQKAKENNTGIFGLTKEQRSEAGKKGGKISGNKHKENRTGVCGRSEEEMRDHGKKWGTIAGKLGGKSTASQVWECIITGYKSTPGGLSSYQKARCIDRNLRVRIS